MVTSILEGPRFAVVLFFCTLGNFLVELTVTGVVMGVVLAVVGNVIVLDRPSVSLVNVGVVFWNSVDFAKLELSDPVDTTVCASVIVVSLVKSLVVPVLEVSLWTVVSFIGVVGTVVYLL